MKSINPSDLDSLTKHYRFSGGKVRAIRYRYVKRQLNIDLILTVTAATKALNVTPKRVRLHLRFVDVEECRFQKRPAKSHAKLGDVRFGFFDGLIYANFDAWTLEPGERPGVFDFRGSDAFIAAKDLLLAELAPSA